MHFKAIFPSSRTTEGVLTFTEESYAFDVEPQPPGFTSVLINDLNLELDRDGRVVSVWGICPQTIWKNAVFAPPVALSGDLVCIPDQPLKAAVSIRLNEERRWPVFVDRSSGWVYVKGETHRTSSVRILPSIVVDLDEAGNLCGLWLKPDVLPPPDLTHNHF